MISMFISCVALAGCGKSPDLNLTDELRILSGSQSTGSSPAENVGIYLDVTPSMDGFLGMDTVNYKELVPETRYAMCLDEIDKIMAAGFDESQLTYYRADTALWEADEDVLKEGRSKSYYKGSKENDEKYTRVIVSEEADAAVGYDALCIRSALLNCKEDDFSVLITDLFENTADASALIQALKQNMDSGAGGKTIGILGIRSEFAGTVYDLDQDGRKEEYGIIKGEITAEDICYRQFYVIVIGQVEEVRYFCQKMQDNMNLDEASIKCTIFYEDIINGLDFTDFNKCHTVFLKDPWKLWPNSQIIINQEYSLDVYDYYNKNNEMIDVVVSYNVPEESLKRELEKGVKSPEVLLEMEGLLDTAELLDMEESELIRIPVYMEEQAVSVWNQETGEFEKEDSKSDIFALKEVYYSPEEELLYVVFQISEKKEPALPLKLSGEIHFERQDDLNIDWVEDWNMGYENEDLGKTRDLINYIDAIRDKMPERSDLLLDFVFYIKSE